MDLLKIVEERLDKFPPDTWDTNTLILLDIAKSLRSANKMAKEGLEFSAALAKQMVGNDQ